MKSFESAYSDFCFMVIYFITFLRLYFISLLIYTIWSLIYFIFAMMVTVFFVFLNNIYLFESLSNIVKIIFESSGLSS